MWFEFLKLFFAAWGFAIVLMGVVWAISRRIRNAGIVDIAWSAGYAPIAILYATLASGEADPTLAGGWHGDTVELSAGAASFECASPNTIRRKTGGTTPCARNGARGRR